MRSLVKTIDHLECVFVGSCNLACEYCFIHKNPSNMHLYNEEIRNSIVDGSFQNNIITKFNEAKCNIKGLSLWSGEPTLNADLIATFCEPLLEFFPFLETFMFSTNGLLGYEKGIKPYIEYFKKYSELHDRPIHLTIQFSLDGPAEITDVSRGYKGITDIIYQTILDTCENNKTLSGDQFYLSLHTKPTVPADRWPKLLENDNLFKWLQFFDILQQKCRKLINNNNYINLHLTQEPTLVTPYNYTKQDGINYGKLIRKLREIDITQLPEYSHPIIQRFIFSWKDSVGVLDYTGSELRCGAGIGSAVIDHKGNIMTCHRMYDSYMMGGEKDKKFAINTQVAFTDKELDRIEYTNAAYQMNHRLSESSLDSLLLAMVAAGEVDKKYIDPILKRLLFVFTGGISCYAGEHGTQTNNASVIPLGTIRLLANGALEELIAYYEDTLC